MTVGMMILLFMLYYNVKNHAPQIDYVTLIASKANQLTITIRLESTKRIGKATIPDLNISLEHLKEEAGHINPIPALRFV